MIRQQKQQNDRESPPVVATVGVAQRPVGEYRSYVEAERAVDHLADHRFPVERVAIVGHGLSLVEKVTGRRGLWSAAGRSAVSGAIIGALLGWVFGVFDVIAPLWSGLTVALLGAGYGAAVGAILGLVGYRFTAGRRDFSSVESIRADRYQVLVDADAADAAARLLAGLPDERPAGGGARR